MYLNCDAEGDTGHTSSAPELIRGCATEEFND